MIEKIERKDSEVIPYYKDLLQSRIDHDRSMLSGIKKILEEARDTNLVSCSVDTPAILTESDNSNSIQNSHVYISLKFNHSALPHTDKDGYFRPIDLYDEVKVMIIEGQPVLIGDDFNIQFKIENAQDIIKQAFFDPPLKNDFYYLDRKPSEKTLNMVRDVVSRVNAHTE
ncbi:MAG: hypothetical protein PHE71_03070 [Candidatus Shapirobacteria bacterium]|nr:hypothetical protein [Candidatus Shapirobacteria bacterium]